MKKQKKKCKYREKTGGKNELEVENKNEIDGDERNNLQVY